MVQLVNTNGREGAKPTLDGAYVRRVSDIALNADFHIIQDRKLDGGEDIVSYALFKQNRGARVKIWERGEQCGGVVGTGSMGDGERNPCLGYVNACQQGAKSSEHHVYLASERLG